MGVFVYITIYNRLKFLEFIILNVKYRISILDIDSCPDNMHANRLHASFLVFREP